MRTRKSISENKNQRKKAKKSVAMDNREEDDFAREVQIEEENEKGKSTEEDEDFVDENGVYTEESEEVSQMENAEGDEDLDIETEMNADEEGSPKKGRKRKLGVSVKKRSKGKKQSSEMKEKTIHKGPEFIVSLTDWHQNKKTHPYTKHSKLVSMLKRLKPGPTKRLKESCFKHILELGIVNFPPKLMQHLIGRLVSNSDPDILTFNFDGRIETFGIKEFCIITGLYSGQEKYINVASLPESSIMEHCFPGRCAIDRGDFEKTFIQYNLKDEEMSEKMAKMFVLYSMLLPVAKTTSVKQLHLRLVEKTEEFNNYPWGRLSYNITLSSIKKVRDAPQTKFHSLDGFPQALIIWAFEVLPALSRNNIFATRIDSTYPRILNWHSSRQGDWKSYENDVFSSPIEVITMQPTEEELETNYLKLLLKERRQKMHDQIGVGVDEELNSGSYQHVDVTADNDLLNDVKMIIEQNYTLKISVMTLNEKVERLTSLVENLISKTEIPVDFNDKNKDSDERQESQRDGVHIQRDDQIIGATSEQVGHENSEEVLVKTSLDKENAGVKESKLPTLDNTEEIEVSPNENEHQVGGNDELTGEAEDAGKKEPKKKASKINKEIALRPKSQRQKKKSQSTTGPYIGDFGRAERPKKTLTQELKEGTPTYHLLSQD